MYFCFGQNSSSLVTACREGRVDEARNLLSSGGEVNVVDEHGDSLLHLASENGHIAVAKLLISRGAQVNRLNAFRKTPLYYACRRDDSELSELLIKSGARVNRGLETPIMIASWYGHYEIVRLLLSHAVDVNQTDKYGCTPLYYACKRGHVRVAELLCEGADVNKADPDGDSPLYIASFNGHSEIVQVLLSEGAQLNRPNRHRGWTALRRASEKNHLLVVKLLAERGADLNLADSMDGFSPLAIASRLGHIDVVKELLAHRADAGLADFYGRTALHLAILGGWGNVVELLLSEVPELLQTFDHKYGMNPLHYAISCRNISIIETLLSHLRVEDINAPVKARIVRVMDGLSIAGDKAAASKDEDTACPDSSEDLGYTSPVDRSFATEDSVSPGPERDALDASFSSPYSVLDEYPPFSSGLLHGGEENSIDSMISVPGETAVHLASRMGFEDVLTLLIDEGADINGVDEDGSTALHFGCRVGNINIVKHLVEEGADINMASYAGDTCLQVASAAGHLVIVTYLLLEGAHTNTKNENGTSSYQSAVEKGHSDVAMLLKGFEKVPLLAFLLGYEDSFALPTCSYGNAFKGKLSMEISKYIQKEFIL